MTNAEYSGPESVLPDNESSQSDEVKHTPDENSQTAEEAKQKHYPQLAEVPEFAPAPKPDVSEADAPLNPPVAAPVGVGRETEIINGCEQALDYVFGDKKLLRQALTHSSIANVRLDSNERLEFLGDSIMGCVICEYLFLTFPTFEEGELTRIKSSVVSRHTCAKTASTLGLDRFLFLGKGLAIHERIPSSIMAAAFEAVIAAIYLDGGWEAACEFVVRTLKGDIGSVSKTAHGENYKSQLQQQSQKVFSQTPTYKLLDEKGPDHSKCFQIAATIGAKAFPPAWGASKKEAEQTAAQNALEVINEATTEPDADIATASAEMSPIEPEPVTESTADRDE